MHTTEQLNTALAGRYAVDRLIGEGGMATVYLARDVRHNRKVALKVLRPDLGAVVGVERFLSEIQVTANLQHPNLLPLFDSGEAGGLLFYVMPYVEGESLRARLSREKQLPVDEAVHIATAVAGALDYAHRHGVIHRDLKPENILMHDGQPLVADFGIALAVSNAGGNRITQTGVSLGTPQYMSPEQATGDRAIDARSDIYSLGAVTYEMLTGEAPHTGSTSQAIIARILTERPREISATRPSVAAHVVAAVGRALEKLPADRWASAKEFSEALSAVRSVPPTTMARSRSRRPGRFLQAGVAVAALGAAWYAGASRASVVAQTARFEIDVIGIAANAFTAVAGAPDGQSFVYCTAGRLWLRRWENLTPIQLAAPPGGCQSMAYSPDGRSLASIQVPTSLRITSLDGSVPPKVLPAQGIGDIATYGGGLDWASDGYVYVASRAGLTRISPTEGTSELVVSPDSLTTQFDAVEVLPGAKAALVIGAPRSSSAERDRRIGVVRFGTKSVDWILTGNAVRYLKPNMLLIAREGGALMLMRFDPGSLRPSGTAVALADSVVPLAFPNLFDVTESGTLLYFKATTTGRGELVFVDRSGSVTEIQPRWTGPFGTPRLSRDGAQVVAELREPASTHAVLRDLRTGRTTRLTQDGIVNGRLAWTPDGRAVSLTSDRDGPAELFLRRPDQIGMTKLPRYDQRPVFGHAWSRDGKWLVIRTDDQASGRGDILAARVGIDSVATPVAASPEYAEYNPALSPDGRWMAFVTNETGTFEVVVTSFPEGRGRWQISDGGGTEPLWSHNGKELFFVAGGAMNVVEIGAGPEFRVVRQRRLFSVAPYNMFGIFNRNYDLTADDARFLMIRHDAAAPRIVSVINWTSELNKLPVRE